MKKDINKILRVNSYGLYTAESCRKTGLPMIQDYYGEYREYADIWLSATRCKRIKQPVKDGENPAAFYRCMHGYCALYYRENNS